MPLSTIHVEDVVFTADGEVGVGAVREVTRKRLVVYFEGYGETDIGPENIVSAHDGKVLVDPATLPADLQEKLAHIHDEEYRRPSET